MGIKGERKKAFNKASSMVLGDAGTTLLDIKKQELISNTGQVNIEEFIKSKGIHVLHEDLEDQVSGYLKKNDQGIWIIGVNRKHSETRKRFTLAHEYAHFVLHKESDDYFVDTTFFRNENRNSMEFAANRFAAEVLMEENLVKSKIKEGIKNIKELSEIFGVSTQAMKLRLLDLGYKLKNKNE